MEIIEYKGVNYPIFQTYGNAAQYAIPYAKYFCKGVGYDIGCNRLEWAYPGAIPIDIDFDDDFHADNLPQKDVDYIFSSHCLEHIEKWVDTLDYWTETLKPGGVLFLYLPSFSQVYWRPWNDRKHRHVLTPEIIKAYMEENGYINIFYSGDDLLKSFMIVGEKSNKKL